ncbi:MAG: hypothetical protein ACLUVC_09755 [Longibaculum sp.]
MKNKRHSFSFLMELIIVIFFFALSSTVCVTFIVKAHEKQVAAQKLEENLLLAQTVIETMQAYPQKSLTQLFDVKEIDNQTYDFKDLKIHFQDTKQKQGYVDICYQSKKVKTFPFVRGSGQDE